LLGAVTVGAWAAPAAADFNLLVDPPKPHRELGYSAGAPEFSVSDKKESNSFGVFNDSLNWAGPGGLYSADISYVSDVTSRKITANAVATVKNLDTRSPLVEDIDGELVSTDISSVRTHVELNVAFSVEALTDVRIFGSLSTFLATSEGPPLTPAAVFLQGPTEFSAGVNFADWTTPNPFDAYLQLAPGTYTLWAFAYGAAGQGAGTGTGVMDVTLEVVPEPASLGVLAVGALGLLVRRRR